MQQKTQDVSDLFGKLQLDTGQKEKIKGVEAKLIQLEEDNTQVLGQYETNLRSVLSGNKEASVQDLSKLDEGIQRTKVFKGEISDLVESLTDELQDLGQFFGNTTLYTGVLEKGLARLGLVKMADRRRIARVRSVDVKQNMQTILDYGHYLVGKFNTAIIDNMQCYGKIVGTIALTTQTLEENEPRYQEWRGNRETLERKIKDVDEKLDHVTGEEYAKLESEKQVLSEEFNKAKFNEEQYFTKVDKAKQALPVQRTHLQAYSDIVNSLAKLKTGLEEDIKHVTEIYMAVPVAIQTALSTKAGGQYDKGMKYATVKSTDTVLVAARGIMDEVASRAERPLIEPSQLEVYRKLQIEMQRDFDSRMERLKVEYAAPKVAAQ